MKKALIYFVVFAALQITFALVAELVCSLWLTSLNIKSPEVLLTVSATTSIVTLALFLGFRWYEVSRDYVRTKPWLQMLWTVILALGIIIPLARLEECLPDSWTTNLIGDEMENILKTQMGYFIICMLAPLVEEVVFRGAILRSLISWLSSSPSQQRNPVMAQWLAIIISALFFAAAHFNPAQIPHALIVGILLGWLCVKTDSIVLCVILHWINNTVAYVTLNLFPTIPMDAKLAAYFGGSTTAVNQAVICSLMLCLPALFQLHRLFKDR